MPYLYTQLWRAHAEHLPVLRPTFFDFGDDPATWADNDEMMVGPDLLVGPGLRSRARARAGSTCRAMRRAGSTGGAACTTPAASGSRPPRRCTGCRCSCAAARWCRPPTAPTTRCAPRSRRARCCGSRPPRARRRSRCTRTTACRTAARPSRCVVHRFTATARTAKLRLEMDSSGSWPLPYKRIRVVLPADEKRKPELVGAMLGGVTRRRPGSATARRHGAAARRPLAPARPAPAARRRRRRRTPGRHGARCARRARDLAPAPEPRAAGAGVCGWRPRERPPCGVVLYCHAHGRRFETGKDELTARPPGAAIAALWRGARRARLGRAGDRPLGLRRAPGAERTRAGQAAAVAGRHAVGLAPARHARRARLAAHAARARVAAGA